MTGVTVIMNGGSGRRRAADLQGAVIDGLGRRGVTADVRLVRSGDDISAAARKAVEQGAKTIVAAGGDGTINGVAQAVAGSEAVLGVLPLGTFNYFARSLDVPTSLEDALDLLATGTARPWPVGEVNGRIFLNNASIGAYPAILREREAIYGQWGRSRIAAGWSVLTTLARGVRPLRITMTSDGDSRGVVTPLVFVANNPYQLSMFNLDEGAAIANGDLAVFVAPDASSGELIRIATDLALGRARPWRDFALIPTDDMTIAMSDAATTVALDGERRSIMGPLRFRLLRDVLKVIAPERSA